MAGKIIKVGNRVKVIKGINLSPFVEKVGIVIAMEDVEIRIGIIDGSMDNLPHIEKYLSIRLDNGINIIAREDDVILFG
jgi:hypothetical protein